MVQLWFSSVFGNKNCNIILESPIATEKNGEWSGQLNFPGDIKTILNMAHQIYTMTSDQSLSAAW
jgi:hypothetical protein